MRSLYERLGDSDDVARLVFAFYNRVLRSERLASHFAEVDMRRLVDHQAKLLSSIMGGPTRYTDEEMKELHADLTIDDQAFEEMVGCLEDVLRGFGLAGEDVAHLLSETRARRRLIVRAG
jgi:hemoglobin